MNVMANYSNFRKLAQMSCGALLLSGCWLSLPAPLVAAEELTIAQANPTRLRIAVLDFDYANTGLTYSWGYATPAQGVSDLLTNRLVESGQYTLIERSRIEEILFEQDLGASGRIDASTAAEVGRLLGADAVVIGSITRFNFEENGGSVSILGFGGGGDSRGAVVELTARLVNTTTGEIIATAEGGGESDRGGGRISTPFGSVGGGSRSDDEIFSEAAEEAVAQLATQLTAAAPAIAASAESALPAVEAIIADVAGGTVIINKGSQDGFRAGMVLSIERVTREVTDPATGEVIRTVTAPVGQIELTEVDERSGVGTIVSGSGLQVGDRARAVE
jgi:curli biogenesis system outer membrane secretion channel CsgG